MRTKTVLLVIGTGLLLAGCASDSVAPYAVSAQSNATLRKLHNKYPNATVRVVDVTFPAGHQENVINCRAAAKISTPTGKPYSDYIEEALIKELELAGMYSSDGSVGVTVELNKVDFSSFPHGAWIIDGTVLLTDGASFDVDTTLPFRTSYFGDSACDHSAAAFEPTVEQFITSIFSNSNFADAISKYGGS